MDRATFRAILMKSTSQKRDLYEEFLSNVPLLKVFFHCNIFILSNWLNKNDIDPNTYIVFQKNG